MVAVLIDVYRVRVMLNSDVCCVLGIREYVSIFIVKGACVMSCVAGGVRCCCVCGV